MKRNLGILSCAVLAAVLTGACAGSDADRAASAEQAASTVNSGAVTATLETNSSWSGGFCDSITIKNAGSAVSNWKLTLASNGSTISSIWSATQATSGATITLTPASYNASIPSGGSVNFGFCGSGNAQPTLTSITANGGNTGTGGATSTGGTTAKGGSSATGGSSAQGGTTAAGGTSAKGGSSATGGSSAQGGSTSAGGSSAKGGSTATGGSSGTAGSANVCTTGTAATGDITVNTTSTLQKISGFGASTAWGSTMSTADADLLWGTTGSSAGLSLHRIRIDTTGTGTSETNIAKLAVARGVTIWATPWTPPAVDKDNNNAVMGHLSNGQDFANKLKTFVSNMKNAGVPIYAVSAQNEPDANVTYESCVYTGDTIASFIANYMGPALSGTVKIMAPETQNWCGFRTFWPLMKANTKAMSYINIVATHEYGCNVTAYPDIAQAGKEFWETEIYDTNSTTDQGIASGLRVAKLIHEALTVANMNAWHYWWVYSTGNGGLIDSSTKQPTKRLYVEGNYARFVRPGSYRIGTSGSAPSGVSVSAYRNPSDGKTVVVAINNNTSAAPLSLYISGNTSCSYVPWVTSTSDSLAQKSALSVVGSRLNYSLPAQSVVTLVSQ
ncbi:MAG: cellulose binding domain-containing protein [Polyangiaceae bacterium]